MEVNQRESSSSLPCSHRWGRGQIIPPPPIFYANIQEVRGGGGTDLSEPFEQNLRIQCNSIAILIEVSLGIFWHSLYLPNLCHSFLHPTFTKANFIRTLTYFSLIVCFCTLINVRCAIWMKSLWVLCNSMNFHPN